MKKHIIVLTILSLAVLLISCSPVQKYTTYSTEESMKNALQGTWAMVSSNGHIMYDSHYIIENDTITTVLAWTEFSRDSIEWMPSKGYIKFGDYKLYSINKITPYLIYKQKDGTEYKYIKVNNTDIAQAKVDPSSDLTFSNIKVEQNSSYTTCTGTITNNGTHTYEFIEVRGAFEDKDGIVLDTDWTYAVGSEGLRSGESSTFSLSVDKNVAIVNCSVEVLDYD